MSGSNTVLIVDDSRVSRMMIRAIVADKLPDWNIIEAASGDDALGKCVEQDDINLMILDYNMPGMNGLDLAVELKNKYPAAPISLLTANVQNSTQEKASALGVKFSSKPITEDRIVDILKQVA